MANLFGEGSAIFSVDAENTHRVATLATKVNATTIPNKQSLINILKLNLQFPSEHREILWRYILRLPMNRDIFLTMAQQPCHPTVRTLPNRLPMKYNVLSQRLVRLISNLAYWHPPLAECDWLPALAFPFLQVFKRDSLITFEVVATAITNWCHDWLHFVPNPPITILSRIDRIARDNGGEAPLKVAWPVLRSFFGEVSTTNAALMILDNIISSRPVFIEYLVACYAISSFEIIDEQNVVKFIKRAKQMYRKDWKANPNQDSFSPLPKGFYPVMTIIQKSPMWREKELQRIRDEADAIKQQIELTEEINRESIKIERQRQAWMRQREALKVIEQEQMIEFRRKERQQLMEENIIEQRALNERKTMTQRRKIEEENALKEWKNECENVRDDVQKTLDSRKATWDQFMGIKEEAAQMTRDEMDIEMKLLEDRDSVFNHELGQHTRVLDKLMKDEQQMLHKATTRNQEIDEERYDLRQVVEKARRKQAENIIMNQVQMMKNNR
ncbi:hypothetical protein TRFO_38962 [Tritrichomonas foetus]|uniref:Rab-GAP TBC domain-containing protein n=1 Tax=Tritrichomonas foetus TaxID=1144522 RepID=A0A1J4J6I6_9EUKA|nr:hypothetical protein TRFO_38962 [Tritrichomonas foetus]|eukprot:OHS94838.1 hypothetical protein TRFO_38962 [Tritrichomonas foetus]